MKKNTGKATDLLIPARQVFFVAAGRKHDRHGWIPALDGLRGLAILAVMLFHYGAYLDRSNAFGIVAGGLFGYGWTGVDLFFVLSGFLITGILLDSRDAENYFSSFYARRILRIFPAYYVSLAILFLILPWMGFHVPLPPPRDRWMHVFYVQNWVGIFHYPQQMVLTPYWSLAVEEQFYFVWPLVVARFAGRKLLRIIAAVCVGVLALRFAAMAAGVAPEAIYANTLTRLDSLLIGAACAVGVRDARLLDRLRRHARWMWTAPLVPFLGVRLLPSRRTDDPVIQSIGFTIIALSYAGLLLGAVLDGNRWLSRFLNSAPLRMLGKYSYAAYICHFGVVVLIGNSIPRGVHVPGVLRIVLMMTTTLLISVASYYLVERWFLQWKRHFEPRHASPATPSSGMRERLPEAAQEIVRG